jgi:hypothetical protein
LSPPCSRVSLYEYTMHVTSSRPIYYNMISPLHVCVGLFLQCCHYPYQLLGLLGEGEAGQIAIHPCRLKIIIRKSLRNKVYM